MERPTSVTVFGILNIVFGAFGLLCAPFALLSTRMFQQLQTMEAGPQSPFSGTWTMTPEYWTYTVVSAVLSVVVSLILITAGIGLLKLKPWARMASIGYSIYAIVMVPVGMMATHFLVWKPLAEQMPTGPGPGQEMMEIVTASSMAGGLTCSLIYPVILLVFMFLPDVKAAFYPAESPPFTTEEPPRA